MKYLNEACLEGLTSSLRSAHVEFHLLERNTVRRGGTGLPVIPATSKRLSQDLKLKACPRLSSEFQDCSVSSWVAELVLALAWKLNEILTEN